MEYIVLVLTVLCGGLIALWRVPVKYEKYVLTGWAVCLTVLTANVVFCPWRMARIAYDTLHFF